MAFPGGMKDPDDVDEIDTCLRESEEEIGLKKHQVQIIAQFLPRINRRQILITPVIGLVDPAFVPESNPDEVEDAFCLPLDRFLNAEEHVSSLYSHREINWIIHWFTDVIDDKQFITWGLTAHLCVQVAMVMFQREPDFEWDAGGEDSVENLFVLQKKYLVAFSEEKGAKFTISSKL